MIFSTGLKKIYESIKTAPKDMQANLYSKLEDKLIASKVLSYKFDLLEAISDRKNKLSKDQADKFINYINLKHNEFLEENNSVALFYKEEKKLMEFFNVDTNKIQPNELDLVINRKDNKINEAVVRSFITDKRIVSGKDLFESNKKDIKKNFLMIRNELDRDALKRKMDRINIVSNFLAPKVRKFVKESLNTIKEDMYKNFSSAINKGYKLDLITEKLLREYNVDDNDFDRDPSVPGAADRTGPNVPDMEYNPKAFKDSEQELSDYNDTGKKNSSNKEFKSQELNDIKSDDVDIRTTQEKELDDIANKKGTINYNIDHEGIFENIVVSVSQDNSAVEIKCELPLYPKAATMGDLMDESRELTKTLLSLKDPFQYDILKELNSKIISYKKVFWNAGNGGYNLNPQDPKSTAGKQIEEKGAYKINAFFNIIMFAKIKTNSVSFLNETEYVLELFSDFLKDSDYVSDILTPEIQKKNLAAAKLGRSKEYKKRDGSYYDDKHDGDTALDDILTGNVEGTGVKNQHYNDYAYFGDAKPDWEKDKKRADKRQKDKPSFASTDVPNFEDEFNKTPGKADLEDIDDSDDYGEDENEYDEDGYKI